MKKLFLVLVVLSMFLLQGCSNAPGELDEFAKCLTENGAEFYGSVTCHNCDDQKEMFGNSLKFVNYIECTKNQQLCVQEEIQYVPTWKFEDGTGVVGVKSFEFLAEKTGCSLD